MFHQYGFNLAKSNSMGLARAPRAFTVRALGFRGLGFKGLGFRV